MTAEASFHFAMMSILPMYKLLCSQFAQCFVFGTVLTFGEFDGNEDVRKSGNGADFL